MNEGPTATVLDALGVSTEGRRLPGGQGLAFQFDDMVLKPCDNPDQWTGLAPFLISLDPVDYRIARPARFRGGHWVVDGWMATEVLEGTSGYTGREPEALAACDAIHRDLRNAYSSPACPDWLLKDDSYYARAHRIAWGEAVTHDFLDRTSRQAVDDLIKYVRHLSCSSPQITHGDPGGDNILFSDHAPPGIIDFSPCWRPPGYAVAIMLADGIAWEGSTPGTLELVADRPGIGQLLLRAVVFRLVVSVLFSGTSRLQRQMEAYDPVIRWAIAHCGVG